MSHLDRQNRAVKIDVLPDMRLRVTERLDAQYQLYKDSETFSAEVLKPWGTPYSPFPECRLISQPSSGQIENAYKNPNDPPPVLLRVYEQIDAEAETQVGEPDVSFDQYGRKTIVLHFIQFSTGTPVYETVGTTACPVDATCILKTQVDTDDGTLRTITRTYIDSGEMARDYTLNYGGNLIILTITSLNEIPATPAGYTLFGPGVEFVEGLPLYKYRFSAVNGGGVPGTGAEISRSFTNSQGGDVAFNPASPDSATGDVICTIRYITALSVTANPITQPAGFVLFALDVQESDGYKMWESKSGFGGGNPIQVEVRGLEDGALLYTVSQNDDDGTLIPAYPGSGTAYNTSLAHNRDNGFFRNVAVWHKPPADTTYKKQTQFTMAGVAEFTGSPPQYNERPPVTFSILADVEVTYDTSQISDTPFTYEAYATYYATWTPTATGVPVQIQKALGLLLAEASGISGTNSNFNGVLCDTWSAVLISSIPSTRPTGLTVLNVDNDPYLTDVDGVKVYRRTKVSYSF